MRLPSIACAIGFLLNALPLPAESEWRQLLDQGLSQWEIWMGIPHKSVRIPGHPPFTSNNTNGGEPLGLKDPLNVFQMQEENGKPLLFITGQIYGGLTTKPPKARK